MRKLSLILSLLLVPSLGLADIAVRGASSTKHESAWTCFLPDTSSTGDACTSGTPIISVTLANGTEANRTVVFNLDGKFSKLLVVTDLTWTATATVVITPKVSIAGSPDALLQSGAVSAGVRTLTNFTDSKSVTADAIFTTEYDVRGIDTFTLVWSGSGATSDTIDVYAVALTGN